MIYWDSTKKLKQKHRSGLLRVSERLVSSLRVKMPGMVEEVVWVSAARSFCRPASSLFQKTTRINLRPDDWIITPEVFGEDEKPGFTEWLATRPARIAGIFHDNIPLSHPDITWPKSVKRHPIYLSLLRQMDVVFAASEFSAEAFRSAFPETAKLPDIVPLKWGADFFAGKRDSDKPNSGGFLTVGILEPRKNQELLLDAMESIWDEGFQVPLKVCGRINPHFGEPIAKRIQKMQRSCYPVEHIPNLSDGALWQAYQDASLSIFPSQAEGAGLPVIESLWAGCPVLANNIPPLKEYGRGPGCAFFQTNSRKDLILQLKFWLEDENYRNTLTQGAQKRTIPLWSQTAGTLLDKLGMAQ